MNAPGSITIYLADDHGIVASAIAGLLRTMDGVESVLVFGEGKDLYMACLARQPDLVILDIEMPGWSGLQTLEKLAGLAFFPVIMLSMNDERSVIESCIKKGAKGYLHKNCTPDELKTSIEKVMSGQVFLSEETQKILLGLKAVPSAVNTLAEPLTDKEIEVLVLVCEGLTSREIGERLFISPRTVETRKNNLMQKFGVQSTGKLVAAALKSKIIK